MVGVEPANTLRFQNVRVRLMPSDTGSPSVPALVGKRSTSSNSTILIGRDASPAGELAPATVSRPPVNDLCSSVLPLSRLFGSAILPWIAGVSRTIGAKRSFAHASPISSVGCTISIGAGS